MKALAYLFVFLLILGVVGFGFFTMSAPNIAQTTVSRSIEPAQAFATTPDPVTAPQADIAPAAP